MYHDEYDVHCRIYGTEMQIEALIMAACLKNIWHIVERCVTRDTTESGRHALSYVVLNEKIWDIDKEVDVMHEMVRIAKNMGLDATITSRRCH